MVTERLPRSAQPSLRSVRYELARPQFVHMWTLVLAVLINVWTNRLVNLVAISVVISAVAALAAPIDSMPAQVRVVPQFAWDSQRSLSAGGRFGASIHLAADYVAVVDLDHRCLAWAIPLPRARDAAFSSDGSLLAACGDEQGIILDLDRDRTTYLPALAGNRILFVPGSPTLLVCRDAGDAKVQTTADLAASSMPARSKEFVHLAMDGATLQTERLQVDVVDAIRVSTDGCRVLVTGRRGRADGDPGGEPPDSLTQIIELHYGQSASARHAMPTATQPAYVNQPEQSLPECDPSRVMVQGLQDLRYDAATGTVAMLGRGPWRLSDLPEKNARPGAAQRSWEPAHSLIVWNAEQNDCRHVSQEAPDLLLHAVYGFVQGGAAVCLAQKADTVYISLWKAKGPALLFPLPDLPEKDWRYLQKIDCAPSPDRDMLALFVPLSARMGSLGDLVLWSLDDGADRVLHREPTTTHELLEWSADGKRFMRLVYDRPGHRRTLELRRRDGQLLWRLPSLPNSGASTVRWPQTTQPTSSPRPIPGGSILAASLDPVGTSVAIGITADAVGTVVVLDASTGAITFRSSRHPIGIAAVRFLDASRLLAADLRGNVQCWDLTAGRPLWSTATHGSGSAFGLPAGDYVALRHRNTGGVLIDTRKGEVVRDVWNARPAASYVKPRWANPCILPNKCIALEASDGSMQVRFVDTRTGHPAVTFCPLPDAGWILYTSDGYWHGSANAKDWMRMYKGRRLLGANEAVQWNQPMEVSKSVKQCLRSLP